MSDSGVTNFGVLVGQLNGGTFVAECSEKLCDVLEKLQEKAMQTNGAASGTITVTLKIKTNMSGLTTIDPSVSGKLPDPVRAQDSYYLTSGGGLSRKNERQQDLPLREVAGGLVETREAGTSRTVKEA